MTITIHKTGGKTIASIISREKIITDVQSALDIVMSACHETGADRFSINKEAFSDEFFILSSTLAGEILQKFVNYQLKAAIYGDFSKYTSKPLKEFMYESNNGNDVFFTATEDEAINILSRK